MIVKAEVTIKVVDLSFNLLVGSVSPFLAGAKIVYLNNNLFMGTNSSGQFFLLANCLLVCLFVYSLLDRFHCFQMLSCGFDLCSIPTFLATLPLPWSILQILEAVVCIACLILHIIVANSMSICSLELADHWSRIDEHLLIWSCTSLIQLWKGAWLGMSWAEFIVRIWCKWYIYWRTP